jgi:hypothetical protein
MTLRQLRIAATLFSLLLAPAMLRACTVCDSSTAQQVRAGIFNSHFLSTLGLVMLPGLLLAAAAPLASLVLFGLESTPASALNSSLHSHQVDP